MLLVIFSGSLSNYAISSEPEKSFLIFSDYAKGIFSYNFKTSQIETLYLSDKNNYVMSVAPLNSHQFIFSECSILGQCDMKIFSRLPSDIKDVGLGVFPFVVGNELFFSQYDKLNKRQNLIATLLSESNELTHSRLVDVDVNLQYLVPSTDGLYYLSNKNNLQFYSFNSQKVTTISANLVPVMFLKEKGGLISYNMQVGNYALLEKNTSNDKHIARDLDFFDIGTPIVIQNGQKIIFPARVNNWIVSETSHIFSLDLQSGDREVLIKHKQLISGFVQ